MADTKPIRSVAVIGAGAAGAVTTSALSRENYFERIRVFERRGTPGGTWIFDPNPKPAFELKPGALPTDIDPPLDIPSKLPALTSPNRQERFDKTPVYSSLTTNVPDIAMSFSDIPFAYGPFVPHHVTCQYLQNYFSVHGLDPLLVLNTTVEDVSKLPSPKGRERWKLTLRRHDPDRRVDEWWEEEFDAVIFGNGHYSIPYIPEVKGLPKYIVKYPNRVVHSKYYRSPVVYRNRKVLVIGNSASGHDITAEVTQEAHLPVYQSRRSAARWDGDKPPPGVDWKPIIKEYHPSGRIIFEDDSFLDDIDIVIYCTGYKVSFPFWNTKNNGRPLWDYKENKLINGYWHTFFRDFPTLGIVGIQRSLSFRSWEYQAIALARISAGRIQAPWPTLEEQEKWENDRLEFVKQRHQKFHDILWEDGETSGWLQRLFSWAGLGTLIGGYGRIPPVLSQELIWALENIRKYPEPKRGTDEDERGVVNGESGEWVVVPTAKKDLLHFI